MARTKYIWGIGFDDRLTFRVTGARLIWLPTQSYPRCCLSILKKVYEKDSLRNERCRDVEDPEFDKPMIVESLKELQNVKSKFANEADCEVEFFLVN